VVIGPNSGTLIFRRRTSVCSLGFRRAVAAAIDRSLSPYDPFWAMAVEINTSGSGLFRPAVIDSLSAGGNNWYLRDSVG